ncbi:MAG: dephospho-CoA kinase, partial [Gammaproteobacteria bacterium]
VLVIDCNEEIQIARVMSRDNLTRPQVEAIMRSQATREQRLTVADDVVDNSRGLDELRAPIAALHAKYTDIAENPGNPQ